MIPHQLNTTLKDCFSTKLTKQTDWRGMMNDQPKIRVKADHCDSHEKKDDCGMKRFTNRMFLVNKQIQCVCVNERYFGSSEHATLGIVKKTSLTS